MKEATSCNVRLFLEGIHDALAVDIVPSNLSFSSAIETSIFDM